MKVLRILSSRMVIGGSEFKIEVQRGWFNKTASIEFVYVTPNGAPSKCFNCQTGESFDPRSHNFQECFRVFTHLENNGPLEY